MPKEPVGGWRWELVEGCEQPLSVQVVLCCLEEQQKQANQGGHLEEPRDEFQKSGSVRYRDTHGAAASGS